MAHHKAMPNHLVETEGVALREAQRKFWLVMCKEKAGPILSWRRKASKLLEDGIQQSSCCLWLREVKERQMKENSWGITWWISSEIFCCMGMLSCCSGETGCLWWEWICFSLSLLWIMALEIPFVTQICTPCASLQLCSTHMTVATASAFYAGLKGQTKCVYGWERHKDVWQKR